MTIFDVLSPIEFAAVIFFGVWGIALGIAAILIVIDSILDFLNAK